MKLKGRDPREVVEQILNRSVCAVKVGAVISDKWGIHSWGWNSSGQTGMGEHAEAHAIRRGNRDRMGSSTLWVAAARSRRNGNKVITARPCEGCQRIIGCLNRIIYRDGEGRWVEFGA